MFGRIDAPRVSGVETIVSKVSGNRVMDSCEQGIIRRDCKTETKRSAGAWLRMCHRQKDLKSGRRCCSI